MTDTHRHPLLPPGETAAVDATSVLLLAPHYDDEVLGCGGLLAQLAARERSIAVLFLTDGAGTAAAGEGPAAHGGRRREEAERALAVLGIGGPDDAVRHLELPDGRLERHLTALEEAVRAAILEHRPDLILVPSPLEATADHRAAFAALHRVLGPTGRAGRASEPLDAAVRDCTVLAYEVNHPAYPDVLVDVSAELGLLREAIACHASQQERHDYRAAGLGLRAFRTLSLPAARERPVEGAEGYRRLVPEDFTTRSPTQLVRHLGGVPELHRIVDGPTISVIVRTKDRPELLREALASLAEGTYRRFEVVVVNDGGRPPELPEDFPVPLRRIDLPETGGRAVAANAGVAAATGEWIGFLDDDDLAAPEHLAVLAGAARGAGVRAVYSDAAVVTYALDPSGALGGWREVERRLPYSRDFDPDLLLVDNYIPFNTVLFERGLLAELDGFDGIAASGPFDPALAIFEDWDFLIRLADRTALHHVPRVTCEYRHFRGAGHHALGERPRERADFLELKARVIARYRDRLEPSRTARVIDRLRGETVEAAEEASMLRRDRREAERARATLEERRARLEERYHRLNGEVEGLRRELEIHREDAEQRGAEIERLYGAEKELRDVVADQEDHLRRTYAEIERLGATLDALRGASLPGLVRWWRGQRRDRDGGGE